MSNEVAKAFHRAIDQFESEHDIDESTSLTWRQIKHILTDLFDLTFTG